MTFAKLKALVFLLAIPLGFAIAVWLGRDAATYSKPDKFVRFHQRLSPESLFYPTFAMMERIALARWAPGQTLVIVAGNSILNGIGQKESELWSLRLQEELGPHYVVVNLSFRGSLPCEAGTLVAESLIKRGLPVVLIANTGPATVGRVAGGPYGYLYYDALAHDRLLPHPARAANLAEWEATAPAAVRERQAELRRAAALDARFHFQALWHHVGYRYGMTVWSQITRPQFWRARDRALDDDPGSPPVAERFRTDFAAELSITRSFTSGLATPTASGGWELAPAPAEVAGELIDAMFPPALRARTVMLLNENAPYYRSRLTPAERARDDFVFTAYAQLWRNRGVACHRIGTDFTDEDYHDRTHLAPSGGRKLAHLTAAYVRQLAAP
jgi:hypothetical protein